MGMAMGENPDIVEEVCGWVKQVAKIPVWAKMTPNVGNPTVPAAAALRGGADGIAMINTILSVSRHRPQDAAADADRRGPQRARRLLAARRCARSRCAR